MKKIITFCFACFAAAFVCGQNKTAFVQETFTLQGGTFHGGSVMRRNDIYFDLSKASLRPESKTVLDSIAAFFLLHPEFTIETGMHTDYENPELSIRLTQVRAQAIVAYLVSKNVPPNRVLAKGYGDSKPLIPEKQIAAAKTLQEKDSLKYLNRRVEFLIIGINAQLTPLFSFSDSAFFPGQVKRYYSILYDLDKSMMRPESKEVIDSVGFFLLHHPGLCLEIGTCTDSRGSDNYNQKLSEMRARSVCDYLIYMGIEKERLSFYGYGETLPLVEENTIRNAIAENAPKETIEGFHRQNRRTEFRITSVLHKSAKKVCSFFSITGTSFSAGSIFPARSVQYETGNATLRPESFPVLDSIAVFLLRHPEITLEIGDYSGSEQSYSFAIERLSQQRADSIAAYLIRSEVPAEQIAAKGYGEACPLITRLECKELNRSEPQNQFDFEKMNRRVEFKIVSVK